MIEIGFPFSDSIADGPTIQASYSDALQNGLRVESILDTFGELKGKTSASWVAMVSMSIVRRFDAAAFAKRLRNSGFDAWLIPDAPIEEQGALAQIASEQGLCNVLMVAPTTPNERISPIAGLSTGFIYLIAARGITGERQDVSTDLADNVARIRAVTDTPILAGFGISAPEQVREVCRFADGAIVGSAIVRRIRDAVNERASREKMVRDIGDYVDELVRATQESK